MSTWWGRLPIQRKYWSMVACAAAGITLLSTVLAWIRTGATLGVWRREHPAVDAAIVASLDGALGFQIWMVGLACMAASAGMGWWVARTLARPVESLARALDEGANPAQALAPHCEDEIAQIAFAAHMGGGAGKPGDDVMAAGRKLIATIRATMQEASRSTGGGDEFRAQIEQVATAIEEMSATIVSVAQSTSEAHGNADDACRTAREGGERVGKAIDGMRKIHARVNDIAQTIRTLGASSEKIGEIVDVIYDIADQTNLLALNAAIEAARVGEQGRGFAVVADEVRKLAERTTKATKEIAEVIKKIQADTSAAVSAMDEGTAAVAEEMEIARQAGDALLRIVEKIELVTDKVQHIAAATEEQSATANAVASNMEQAARLSRETNEWTVRALGQIQQIDRCAHEFEGAIGPADASGVRKPSLRLVDRAA